MTELNTSIIQKILDKYLSKDKLKFIHNVKGDNTTEFFIHCLISTNENLINIIQQFFKKQNKKTKLSQNDNIFSIIFYSNFQNENIIDLALHEALNEIIRVEIKNNNWLKDWLEHKSSSNCIALSANNIHHDIELKEKALILEGVWKTKSTLIKHSKDVIPADKNNQIQYIKILSPLIQTLLRDKSIANSIAEEIAGIIKPNKNELSKKTHQLLNFIELREKAFLGSQHSWINRITEETRLKFALKTSQTRRQHLSIIERIFKKHNTKELDQLNLIQRINVDQYEPINSTIYLINEQGYDDSITNASNFISNEIDRIWREFIFRRVLIATKEAASLIEGNHWEDYSNLIIEELQLD